jgi:hypothetical protein
LAESIHTGNVDPAFGALYPQANICLPLTYDARKALCHRHNLAVIKDCHGFSNTFPNRPVTYSPVNYAAVKALTRAHDKEWSVSKPAELRHPSFFDIICLQLPGITLGLHQSLSVSRKVTVSALAGKSSTLTLFAPTVSHNTIPSNYVAGPITTIQHSFSLKRSSIANILSSRTSKHTDDIFARSKTRISSTAGGDVVT